MQAYFVALLGIMAVATVAENITACWAELQWSSPTLQFLFRWQWLVLNDFWKLDIVESLGHWLFPPSWLSWTGKSEEVAKA
jgi:hypothetical protein